MRLALAQINPTVGDLEGNRRLIGDTVSRAAAAKADLVLFPELSVCGYPPRDLIFEEDFVERCVETAHAVAGAAPRDLTILLGCPTRPEGVGPPASHNSLLAFRDGALVGRHDKRLLPTYDVFDEDRHFRAGTRAVVIDVPDRAGVVSRVGLAICEDLWHGDDVGTAWRYAGVAEPIAELGALGATLIAVASASPFVLGKTGRHRAILRKHAARLGAFVASVNQVGANDDLVFNGDSCIIAPGGSLVAAGRSFAEDLIVHELPAAGAVAGAPVADPVENTPLDEQAFRALVLGTRDYCRKTGFGAALIGLSGGIDSALTACVGVAALGTANITGVAMPSRFSSSHSVDDARELGGRLGIRLIEAPIECAVDGVRGALVPPLAALGQPALGVPTPDVADENLQSRVRGTIMMTLSNRTGAIVLTTGNKSELAVGYCTLYGDMNGGLAVLSDVDKGRVYSISRWLNSHAGVSGFGAPPIPERSIEKPPSAELRPNQTDQDSLPPYDVLDAMLERVVEKRESVERIARETGFDAALVRRIARMTARAEYKRQQAAVGLKITSLTFGSGRRVPIAQRWGG